MIFLFSEGGERKFPLAGRAFFDRREERGAVEGLGVEYGAASKERVVVVSGGVGGRKRKAVMC